MHSKTASTSAADSDSPRRDASATISARPGSHTVAAHNYNASTLSVYWHQQQLPAGGLDHRLCKNPCRKHSLEMIKSLLDRARSLPQTWTGRRTDVPCLARVDLLEQRLSCRRVH